MQTGFLVFFATLSVSFGIAYWATFEKLKKSNFALTKLFIENEGLKEVLSKTNISIDTSDEGLHKENFIKFLSDSRDWAFEYIEKSQQTIKEVSTELNNKGLNSYSEKLLALLPEENFKTNEK